MVLTSTNENVDANKNGAVVMNTLSYSTLLSICCISRGCCCRFELPGPPAKWASLFCLSRQPLGDALKMKGVTAYTPNDGAVVPRIFAIGGTTIKRHSANAANIVPCIPSPTRHGVPMLYVDLEAH